MGEILAIAASARRGGNSDIILERALEPFREAGHTVEKLIPYELSITPCRSCHGCWNTGQCVVHDAMKELYVRFCEVDHVAVASPIYFTALPGHFKVLIDRFQCFWARTYLLEDKPEPRRSGLFLCAGAMHRERYYQSCLTTVKSWLSVLNVGCSLARFFPGLDERRDVEDHPEYLEGARELARELLRTGEIE
jgi:multimeric flavodoxin WrbA